MFLPLQILMGQDKIITVQQDTILCRIISISPTHIQYEQREDGHIIGRFISTEQVLKYFRTAHSPTHTPRYHTRRERSKPPHRWLIGMYPGGATLLGSTANNEKSMIEMGIPKSATSMQAIGYKEILSAIDGEISLSEAVIKIKQESRRYAKRQLTWLRRDKNIQWLEIPE